MLVWRWRTCRDPYSLDPKARIAHPLAHRAGQRVRVVCRGPVGRLLEFEDGFRVVAPFYAAGER